LVLISYLCGNIVQDVKILENGMLMVEHRVSAAIRHHPRAPLFGQGHATGLRMPSFQLGIESAFWA